MSRPKWGLVLLCLFFMSACLGVDRRGGVLKYQKGVVQTGTGHFTVPQLPPPWKSPKIRLKQLVHENDAIQATIVTDALCGPKYDPAPLSRLAHEFFYRLEKEKIEKQTTLTLDGRKALRVRGRGELDGVPIQMDVVVMKKDFCLYDMVYFAPPETFSQGAKDFEGYFYGFKTSSSSD